MKDGFRNEPRGGSYHNEYGNSGNRGNSTQAMAFNRSSLARPPTYSKTTDKLLPAGTGLRDSFNGSASRPKSSRLSAQKVDKSSEKLGINERGKSSVAVKKEPKPRVSIMNEVAKHNATVQALYDEISLRKSEIMKNKSLMLSQQQKATTTIQSKATSPTLTPSTPATRASIIGTPVKGRKTATKENESIKKSPVIRKEEIKINRRRLEENMLIFNLFEQSFVNVALPKTKIKLYLGRGNNSALVERMMVSKGMVDMVIAAAGAAHICWTQYYSNNSSPSNINSVSRHLIKQYCHEYPLLKNATSEILVKHFMRQNLFMASEADLKAIFDRLLGFGKLNGVIGENINMVNHIKGMKYISKKSELAQTIMTYCNANKIDSSTIIPPTYLLSRTNFNRCLEDTLSSIKKSTIGFTNPFIVKPGENSNRGIGIGISYTEEDLKKESRRILDESPNVSTVVVQQYISKPLLFKNRKFDMRCYILLKKMYNRCDVYWYRRGYMRTSSYDYNLNEQNNLMVHLTNEGIQAKSKETFGKFEDGNKIYLHTIEEHFSKHPKFIAGGISFYKHLFENMKVGIGKLTTIENSFADSAGIDQQDLRRDDGHWLRAAWIRFHDRRRPECVPY